ncbi:hypothetical protein BJ875DRAFT_495286 [Amylocarpus encephaloides]|uniref:Uncharacterized protein n=1 Tax=Amylocarpus encephaloides TaxID=45428 RepID=A0A9P7YKG3_9HELO|nr:hypothetical protein BJ875DRAFT_495286 [Amylocarpus encephaloides]
MDSSAEESGRVLLTEGTNALVLEVGELPPLPEPSSPMTAFSSSLAWSGGLRPIDRSMPSVVDAESLKSREDSLERLEICNDERERLVEYLNHALGEVAGVSSELCLARQENMRLSNVCTSLSTANLDANKECSLLRNEHSAALAELTTTRAGLDSMMENLAGSQNDYRAALTTIEQLNYISSGKQVVLWKFIDALQREIQELKNGKSVHQIDDTITPKIEDVRTKDYPRLVSGEPMTMAIIEESMKLLGPFPKLGSPSSTSDEIPPASTIIQLDGLSPKANNSHHNSHEHKDESSPAAVLKEPVVAPPTWAELVRGNKGKAHASAPSKAARPKPNLRIKSDITESESMRASSVTSSKRSGESSKAVVTFNPVAQAFVPSSPTKSTASSPSTLLPPPSAPSKVAIPTSVETSTPVATSSVVAASSSILPFTSMPQATSLISSTVPVHPTVPAEQQAGIPAVKMVPIYPMGPVPSSIMRYPDNHPVFQGPQPPTIPLGLGPTQPSYEATRTTLEDRAEYLIQEAIRMPRFMLDLCINTLAPEFHCICPISISGGNCDVQQCRLRKVCDLYNSENFLSGNCAGGCGMIHISKTCISAIEDRNCPCVIYNRVHGLNNQETLFRQIHTIKWAHKGSIYEMNELPIWFLFVGYAFAVMPDNWYTPNGFINSTYFRKGYIMFIECAYFMTMMCELRGIH